MAHTDFLSVAREYVARGWSVIPVKENDKKPAILWEQFQARRPTDAELVHWFGNGKAHNIGIVTGPISKLLVVDDDRAKHGLEPLAITSTHLISQTPSGGKHYFYSTDQPLKSGQGDIEDYVDTRGAGGYVVAYPSSIEGKPYVWVEQDAPSPVPPVWVEKLTKKVQNIDLTLPVPGEGDSQELYMRVLRSGFTPGQHNSELLQIARYLYRASQSEVLTFTTCKALDLADPTPQSDVHGQFEATVKQAIKYEKDRLQKKEVHPTKPEHMFMEVTTLLDFGIKWHDYETRYLVQDFLPEQSIMYMSAPPESFKTWLLLDLAVSVALADKDIKFLGHYEVQPHLAEKQRIPVLIFQQEDHHGEVYKRLNLLLQTKTQGVEWQVTIDGNNVEFDHPYYAPIYLHEWAEFRLDDDKAIARMREEILRTGAKLVLIDPFYSLLPAKDYFAEAGSRLAILKQIREETGATFLFAHHSKKSADGNSGRGGTYGSVFFDGAMEGAWIIQKTAPAQIKVTVSGKFHSKPKTHSLVFDINDGQDGNKYNYSVSIEEQEEGGMFEDDIVELLQAGALTNIELTNELGLDAEDRGRVYQVLTRMVKTGELIKTGTRKNAKYSIPIDMGA